MPSLRGLLCVLLLPFHTAVLGLAAIVATLLLPRRDPTLVLARFWSRLILATAGVRVISRHGERSRGGPHVVISNHQSLFDIPALVLTLRCRFRIVAKQELFWIPVFGWALRTAGFIAVDRGRREKAIASLTRGVEALRSGATLVVFAEGTRSRDGNLQPLKKGAFHLAQQVGAPILPVTVSGSRHVLGRSGWVPRPGTIEVVVGEPLPLPPPGNSTDDMAARVGAALRAGYTALHELDLRAETGRAPARPA